MQAARNQACFPILCWHCGVSKNRLVSLVRQVSRLGHFHRVQNETVSLSLSQCLAIAISLQDYSSKSGDFSGRVSYPTGVSFTPSPLPLLICTRHKLKLSCRTDMASVFQTPAELCISISSTHGFLVLGHSPSRPFHLSCSRTDTPSCGYGLQKVLVREHPPLGKRASSNLPYTFQLKNCLRTRRFSGERHLAARALE